MYYKLFNIGNQELIDVVQIPGDLNMKENDIFLYAGRYCKIIKYIRVSAAIDFNKQGNLIPPIPANSIEMLKEQPLPELYITEIPRF